MNGKGSDRRPMKITEEEFKSNWDRTFNNAGSQIEDQTIQGREGQSKGQVYIFSLDKTGHIAPANRGGLC